MRSHSCPELLVVPATACRLQELHVTNNNITNLPPQLGLMAPMLHVLALEGNVLRTIRRPLLERGTDALLAYLRDRIPT
jgi:hypothetical protein